MRNPWLASQAEELGVEIYAAFADAAVLYDNNGTGGQRRFAEDKIHSITAD